MKLRLAPVTRDNCLKMVEWRNHIREGLRTPYMVTEAMQNDFYDWISKDRKCEHRYWEIHGYTDYPGSAYPYWRFCGLTGLTDIEWENSLADISLFLDPDLKGKGIGAGAVKLVFEEGFDRMGLHQIWGECYVVSPSLGFWQKMISKYHGTTQILPDRKFWNGRWYDSCMLSFLEGGWREERDKVSDSTGGPVCRNSDGLYEPDFPTSRIVSPEYIYRAGDTGPNSDGHLNTGGPDYP